MKEVPFGVIYFLCLKKKKKLKMQPFNFKFYDFLNMM